MTNLAPDRTDDVRGKTIKTFTRGKAAAFLVVADAKSNTKIAWLIEKGPENEMATTLAVVETFDTEEAARASYPSIPPDDVTQQDVKHAREPSRTR